MNPHLQPRILLVLRRAHWFSVSHSLECCTVVRSRVNVRGTTRLTSAAIGEVLNRVWDVVIWLMSANKIYRQPYLRTKRKPFHIDKLAAQ
jgi:hypothetical protein